MSNSIHLISLLLLASGLSIHAQEKRAMTFDEMVGWERISEQRISDNGKWVFCKMEPWRGDATILLYNDKGEEKGSFKPAAKAQFSSSSEYLLVTKTPPLKEVEAEKLKKTDKDKMQGIIWKTKQEILDKIRQTGKGHQTDLDCTGRRRC